MTAVSLCALVGEREISYISVGDRKHGCTIRFIGLDKGPYNVLGENYKLTFA